MQRHHPPHIYLDDAWYIVSASTHERLPCLQPEGHKDFVRDQLRSLVAEFKLKLAAWVILNDHYHLLLKSHVGEDLGRFIQRLHGSSSYELNKRDAMKGRRIWHNFWDTYIRGEKDYWIRFNYIHHNPIKHGYVRRMEDWPYSSYGYYLRTQGEEWLADAFRRYPIVDFTDDADEVG